MTMPSSNECNADSREKLIRQGRQIAEMFVVQRLALDHVENAPSLDDLHTSMPDSGDAQLADVQELVGHLQQVADEMDNDAELGRLLGRVPENMEYETLERLCDQILRDGGLNWGRIFVFFYICYRLIKRFLYKGLHIIREILDWLCSFIRNRLVTWIERRGGWRDADIWFHWYAGPTGSAVTALALGTVTLCILAAIKISKP